MNFAVIVILGSGLDVWNPGAGVTG